MEGEVNKSQLSGVENCISTLRKQYELGDCGTKSGFHYSKKSVLL